jgi:nucleoside-diphosphate-sugar epimerase
MPGSSLRIAVVGATGNFGTSVTAALQAEPSVAEIVGIARRIPDHRPDKVTWVSADAVHDDLVPHFRGADAVVHLAWLIQPSHDPVELHRVNVVGSQRIFDAAAAAGVPALLYASSIGAYSAGPKLRMDESYPTHGVAQAWYSRHKAYVERLLDLVEMRHPEMRVVRFRPALVFKREAAAGIRRLFFGPLLPNAMVRPGRLPLVPNIPGLQFQVVHSHDVGEAFRLAVTGDARGAFNLATEPVVNPKYLAEVLGSRTVPVPRALARAAAAVTWAAHLQPTSPDWLALALDSPLLDTTRAHTELGWSPRWTAGETLRDLFTGIADEAGAPTPHLEPGRRTQSSSRPVTATHPSAGATTPHR